MAKFLKRALYIFLLLYAQLSFSQAILDKNEAVQPVTVQNDTAAIKTFAFLEEKDYKHQNHLWYASYFRNQIMRTQGSHVGRLLHGKYQQFNRLMQLEEEGIYINGLQFGLWRYWKEGYLAKTIHWRNGRMQGEFEEYDANGQLIVKGNYKKGLLDGWYTTFENGEIITEVKYNRGEEVVAKEKKRKKSTEEEKEVVDTQETPSRDKNRPPAQQQNKATETEQQAPKTRRARRKQTSTNTSQVETEENSTSISKEIDPAYIQIFITDNANQQALKQVSIKVSQFTRSAQDERFKFFGYTDEDGYYQLLKDSADYVLFITHKGYTPHQLRIYEKDGRTSYHIALSAKKSCGELAGKVQPASKNIALAGVTILIKDERGRLLETTYSNTQGLFTTCLPCGKRYKVHIQQTGYEDISEQVFLPSDCDQVPQEMIAYLPSIERKEENIAPTRPGTFYVDTPTESQSEAKNNTTSRMVAFQEQNQGAFKVIAGTFSQRSNAVKRLEEVRLAGFSEAGIIQIKDSGYFAVCLGVLSSRDAAEALRNQFKSATRLQAYVRDE